MQIVMVNAHWNNRGDEAAIRAIVDGILSHHPDVKLTIIFKDKKDISQFPYQGVIDYFISDFLIEEADMKQVLACEEDQIPEHLLPVIHAIRRADGVIYAPGGAVISDRFWWKKQLEYLFPVAYAQKLHIPVVFAAPSIGPFSVQRDYRTEILSQVDRLCVRENISYDALRSQGITENTYLTGDSAFLNEVDVQYYDEICSRDANLVSFMKKYDRIVGITITDFLWHVEYQKNEKLRTNVYDTFKHMIGWLDGQGIGVLLIPQLFGNQNDKDYLFQFDRDNTFVLDDHYDAYFQEYISHRLYAVIGVQYHSNIFAAKAGTPFVPIIYEEKMRGFMHGMSEEQLSIELEELSLPQLIEKFLYLEEHYDKIAACLDKHKITWKEKAEMTYQAIEDTIFSKNTQ